jgi:hypothetical protein
MINIVVINDELVKVINTNNKISKYLYENNSTDFRKYKELKNGLVFISW